jgi:hypothetical protein
VEKSIAHLAPIIVPCPCPDIGRDIAIAVDFLGHCYTKAFDGAVHGKNEILFYDGGSRPRVFCPDRYQLSFQLPDLLRTLPGKKVFQTTVNRNYLYAVTLPVEGVIYEIYFMLKRDDEECDLRLIVESAYPVAAPSAMRKRPNQIRFNVLAYKILRNETVRFSPR